RKPRRRNGAMAASTHFVNTLGARASPNGSALNWYAIPPNANLRYLRCLWWIGTWKYATFESIVINQSFGLINCTSLRGVFSTHGDTAHARQLATQPGRLCFELNLSGTNLLMVNESKPRSTPTPPREEDEIWGCPLMFLKKIGGCDYTVCIAGGVAQACLGTAPSGTGIRTYECGACENLLTVLDMI